MDLLIDSHAHLADPAFSDDLDEVVERAELSGISHVVGVAETIEDAEKTARLAERYDLLAPTIGIHPHRASAWSEQTAARLASLAKGGRLVAIGEIGLDYHYDFSPRESQRRAFREQLRLAKQVALPVIIHCREAFEDLAEILEDEAPLPRGGVLHCFSGTAEQARRIQDLGLHIGIGGMVTFRKQDDLRRVVAEAISLDRLLVETDSPYLAPEPRRGRRNEPAYVRYTAEKIAELRGIEPARLAQQTRRNAMDLFGLGPEIEPASIAYVLRDSLYLNITNRCTNNCVFCARTGDCRIGSYSLRLPREPTVAEIIAAVGEHPEKYAEVVFCGFGEPTLRLDVLLKVGKWLKSKGVRRVRLNTNGHGNAVHGRSIVEDLASVVDAVSVSLNAPDPEKYARLCRPEDKRFGLEEVCRFIGEAKSHFGEVVASAVAYPGVDMEECRALAENRLGVSFRRREYVPHETD